MSLTGYQGDMVSRYKDRSHSVGRVGWMTSKNILYKWIFLD